MDGAQEVRQFLATQYTPSGTMVVDSPTIMPSRRPRLTLPRSHVLGHEIHIRAATWRKQLRRVVVDVAEEELRVFVPPVAD